MRVFTAHSFDSQYEAQRLYSPTGATRNDDDDDNLQNASGLFLLQNFETSTNDVKIAVE